MLVRPVGGHPSQFAGGPDLCPTDRRAPRGPDPRGGPGYPGRRRTPLAGRWGDAPWGGRVRPSGLRPPRSDGIAWPSVALGSTARPGYVRWASTGVLLVIVIFLATAVYSASQIRPHVSTANGASDVLEANGAVRLTSLVNISNPGFYPLTNVQLAVNIVLPTSGDSLHGNSTPLDISGGLTQSVPLTISVPLTSFGAVSLLTNDATLPTDAWFNATYAYLFPIHVLVPANISWGAPFEGLTNSISPPVPQNNSTVLVSFTTQFQNQASFDDSGQLVFSINNAGDRTCLAHSIQIYVPAGQSFTQVSSVYVPTSCDLNGGHIVSAFVGPGFQVQLPSEVDPMNNDDSIRTVSSPYLARRYRIPLFRSGSRGAASSSFFFWPPSSWFRTPSFAS